jgi:hypothetical protein
MSSLAAMPTSWTSHLILLFYGLVLSVREYHSGVFQTKKVNRDGVEE